MSVVELRLAEIGRLAPSEQQLDALGKALGVYPASLLQAVVIDDPNPWEVDT
jgi:hypothetical protein